MIPELLLSGWQVGNSTPHQRTIHLSLCLCLCVVGRVGHKSASNAKRFAWFRLTRKWSGRHGMSKVQHHWRGSCCGPSFSPSWPWPSTARHRISVGGKAVSVARALPLPPKVVGNPMPMPTLRPSTVSTVRAMPSLRVCVRVGVRRTSLMILDLRCRPQPDPLKAGHSDIAGAVEMPTKWQRK